LGRITITGEVASTRPMQAYGGVSISRELIEALADKLRSGNIPIRLRHDPRRSLNDVVVRGVTTRQDDDGETLVEVTLDVDEEEFERKGGSVLGGFSVSIIDPFLTDGVAEPVVTISADAHWFSDTELEAAYRDFSRHDVTVRANHLYQFADVSTALVLLQFIGQQIATMPAGILCIYIHDALQHLFRRRRLRAENTDELEPSIIDMSFDPGTGRITKAHIRTTSEDVMKQAIDKLPDIISSNRNARYEYSEERQIWIEGDS
jgi:hypothetical protein